MNGCFPRALLAFMLVFFVVVAELAGVARANDFRRGPLALLSDPDPLLACGAGFTVLPENAQAEPYIAVNPSDPKHIVAVWIGARAKAIIGAVTFDEGKRWQQVVIPGTQCTGGSAAAAGDPWVSIAPDGDVYVSSRPFLSVETFDFRGVAVSKSSDKGLHWSSPVLFDVNTDARFGPDKPTITADATESGYVYAAWEQAANGNRRFMKFARTTDGGVTWEPARQILDLGNSDQAQDPQILVMPDGTLVCVFLEVLFANSNGGAQKEAILAVIHSADKGQTWSGPIQGPRVPIFQATDPDTGSPYVNQNSYPPAFGTVGVDRRNGNLYVVFEDTHFSGAEYSDIAFTMSGDRGSTWSVPIPVNKTPANIPAGNRQAFLPSVAVAADGTIAVSYYDFRNNTPDPGLPTDYWLVHCHPTLATPATSPSSWSSETRLTDRSFDLEQAVNPFFGLFLGDYMGLAAAGNDFVAIFTQATGTDPDSMYFRRVGP